jgi:hypothetical protein
MESLATVSLQLLSAILDTQSFKSVMNKQNSNDSLAMDPLVPEDASKKVYIVVIWVFVSAKVHVSLCVGIQTSKRFQILCIQNPQTIRLFILVARNIQSIKEPSESRYIHYQTECL